MQCPHCQHENRPGAKFCSRCRTELRRRCPQCGTEVALDDRFCSECGADLPAVTATSARPLDLESQLVALQQTLPASLHERLFVQDEGENRVLTVLFADLCASVQTTLHLPPEDAAARVNEVLKAMVDAILTYQGRINRLLGDEVLAFFGTPQAHENDPERAILAALAIREAVQRLGLNVTVGINTGEVYLGEIGSTHHHEWTAMGTAINLAARLRSQAQPGQILVGETTYRQSRRAFEFEAQQMELKGIAEPVMVYEVLRPLPRPEKTRGVEGLRAELIGRDEEFAKLADSFAAVLRGRGQMVSVIGEAGVGKSRLIAELKAVAMAPQEGETLPVWLEGRCLDVGMAVSYWPFLDLFRQYFAWHPDDDEPRRADSIVAALRELVQRGDLSATRMEEIGPLLGHLLSVRFGTDWDERLTYATPEQIRHQTFLAIHDVLVALARRQPVVVVLEDLHWADTLSLDVVSLLMEALRLGQLLLLCIYRPEHEHKCWHLATIAGRKCPDRYTEIRLRELSPEHSRRLVEALLRIEDLPAAVKEMVIDKAQGNPFFVEEVVRALIDAGMVYQEGSVWRARAGIETVAVPETIQSVILSRVDRLESDLKQVLQSAAVIGRLFRRRLLAYVTQQENALDRALWELEDRALIYEERAVPEEEYSFQHVLTQETVYQNIVRRRRVVFHRQVAEAIETLYQENLEAYYEQLAHHYDQSDVAEKAVEYLVKAGEKARCAYLNDAAIGYFQRALERLDASALGRSGEEWRLQALQGLGRVYQLVGNMAEAEDYLRRAIALGRELALAPRQLVRLYYWLAEVLWWPSRFDERIRIGEEGLALLGDDPESAEAASMNTTIGWSYYVKGDFVKALESTFRNAQFIDRLPYSEELRAAYIHIIIAYVEFDKNLQAATKWTELFERTAEHHHDLPALASAYVDGAALICEQAGDFRQALQYLERGLEVWTKIGDDVGVCYCCLRLAGTYLVLGDLKTGEEYARRAHTLAEVTGGKLHMAWAYSLLGTSALCNGLLEQAVNAFENARHIVRDIGGPNASVAAIWEGRAYLAQGKRQEAVGLFEEALVGATLPELVGPALSGLEEAAADTVDFHALVARLRAEHEELGAPSLAQWMLEATEANDFLGRRKGDSFAESLAPEWIWRDPYGDCSFTVGQGLDVHAANGRDLWHNNLSAPRIVQPVAGDFAVQAICSRAVADKPSIGGILIWKDQANFLSLLDGLWGQFDIAFRGCANNHDELIGHGRLPAERVWLRMERRGQQVRALCSPDGSTWLAVGQRDFPVEDPLEVGLHAVGWSWIDRIVYPGAPPDGTAIRFEMFELDKP